MNENDVPMIKITIYHYDRIEEKWTRFTKMASFRNVSSLNRDTNGVSESDNALIRIFDFDGYNEKWFCEKQDIIVNKEIKYEVQEAPITELSKIVGKENVYQVTSIAKYVYGLELDHIKIEAK